MLYCMNASSSLLVALVGGPCSFAFSFPRNAYAEPANSVPRVAIESYKEEVSICFDHHWGGKYEVDSWYLEAAGEDIPAYHMRTDFLAEESVIGHHGASISGLVEW